MNVTKNKETGEINTDGCTKIEWIKSWDDDETLYNKDNKGSFFSCYGKNFIM